MEPNSAPLSIIEQIKEILHVTTQLDHVRNIRTPHSPGSAAWARHTARVVALKAEYKTLVTRFASAVLKPPHLLIEFPFINPKTDPAPPTPPKPKAYTAKEQEQRAVVKGNLAWNRTIIALGSDASLLDRPFNHYFTGVNMTYAIGEGMRRVRWYMQIAERSKAISEQLYPCGLKDASGVELRACIQDWNEVAYLWEQVRVVSFAELSKKEEWKNA